MWRGQGTAKHLKSTGRVTKRKNKPMQNATSAEAGKCSPKVMKKEEKQAHVSESTVS